MSEQMILTEARLEGDTCHIDLWYPSVEGSVKYLDIGLIAVRASDGIRVSYDFDRDGWKIEQPSVFKWAPEDKVCDLAWREVAFVQSWQFDKQEGDEE
jgi:hypothetical protein